MKIKDINDIQKDILMYNDKGYGLATCGFFHNSKERYQKLLKFYYTGERKFMTKYPLSYLYFSKYYKMLDKRERDQITYYRLFMLEIFKDVVRNGTNSKLDNIKVG